MSSNQISGIRPILTYLGITLALSSIFYCLIIFTQQGGFGLYVTGLMWCPGAAGMITARLYGRTIASLGWEWGVWKYQLWSYLVPILYALAAYLIIWVAGWGGFYNHEFVKRLAESFGWGGLSDALIIPFYFVLAGIYGMAKSMATALGEEIGWRGFLVPELAKHLNYTNTSLLSGVIWAMWHFPILIFGDYNGGTPIWYSLSCFLVLVLGISFVFAWFRLRSGSLWTGVILHASHNLFIQQIFTPLTSDTGNTKYYIDEFGIVLPVVCLFFALYFWRRRGELNNDELATT